MTGEGQNALKFLRKVNISNELTAIIRHPMNITYRTDCKLTQPKLPEYLLDSENG
ncbi:MAG TPA: hypothetical protein VIP70_01945 [Nitrososphaeraceae archaeon]